LQGHRSGLTRDKEIRPRVWPWNYGVESGLLSYEPGITESFKTLAVFVDKLLKGADASNIPIEQVSKIGLTLNLVAARALGLNVPQAILVRADMVIE
jgi:ABC-type uncharacterized transport system substrate-binding protein